MAHNIIGIFVMITGFCLYLILNFRKAQDSLNTQENQEKFTFCKLSLIT